MTKLIRNILTLVIILFSTGMDGSAQSEINYPPEKTALILIDIQMFYFPGGFSELVDPESSSLNARQLLTSFRKHNLEVIHIRHNTEEQEEIHPNVAPVVGEKVISKDKANGFAGTELQDYLETKGITHLVIAGMMTHMCVEATTRAASDMGFDCTVVNDACSTRDLSFEGTIIKAKDVHLSTLSSLNRTYARILSAEQVSEILNRN